MIKLQVLVFILSILLFSCSTKKQETYSVNEKSIKQKARVPKPEKKEIFVGDGIKVIDVIEDTLTTKTILKRLEEHLYKNNLHTFRNDDYTGWKVEVVVESIKRKYFVLYIQQKDLYLYEMKKQSLVEQNHITLTDDQYLIECSVTDANGDGNEDITIMRAFNMHGAEWKILFLWQEKQGFVHIPEYYKLTNAFFNTSNNLLYASYMGGAFSTHSRSLYKWQNNKPILIIRTERTMLPDASADLKYYHYDYTQNKEVLKKEFLLNKGFKTLDILPEDSLWNDEVFFRDFQRYKIQ